MPHHPRRSSKYCIQAEAWAGNTAVEGAFGGLLASSPTNFTVTHAAAQAVSQDGTDPYAYGDPSNFTSGLKLSAGVLLLDVLGQPYNNGFFTSSNASYTEVIVADTQSQGQRLAVVSAGQRSQPFFSCLERA